MPGITYTSSETLREKAWTDGRHARDSIPGRGNGIDKYPHARNSTGSPGMKKLSIAIS